MDLVVLLVWMVVWVWVVGTHGHGRQGCSLPVMANPINHHYPPVLYILSSSIERSEPYLDALLDAQHVQVQQHHDADLGRGVEDPVEELALWWWLEGWR